MPVILTTQEVEIRRITVLVQPRQKVWETHLSQWLSVVAHAHPSHYAEKHKYEDCCLDCSGHKK
jgi:hypothetical protein